MNSAVKAIILIVVMLVVLAIGAGLGITYQIQKDAPKIAELNRMATTIKLFSSGVIQSTSISGKVTNIQEHNIALLSAKSTVIVPIAETAPIYSFNPKIISVKNLNPDEWQQKVDFKEIKLGDDVNVDIKVFSDGTFQGQVVVIRY